MNEIVLNFPAAGAPEDVQMRCFSNEDRTITYTLVTWKTPKEARGTIQGYNVSGGIHYSVSPRCFVPWKMQKVDISKH